jgi:hypothetical protein
MHEKSPQGICPKGFFGFIILFHATSIAPSNAKIVREITHFPYSKSSVPLPPQARSDGFE